MDHYNTEDAIFALATAWAKSAIAVVRVSGQGCIEALSKAVKGRQKERINTAETNTVVYCRLFNPKDNSDVDDVVVTIYRDGHGYTGEEAFEISCHGGLTVVTAVLQLMADLGFRQALPGEFTLRAFLHGKMDLTRSEAVNELVNAQGRKGQLMALNRLNGALYKRISQIKDTVSEMMSIVEVQLDYSEDEIGEDLTFPMDKLDSAIEALGTIHDSYNAGRLYSQGARIVLAGPSNAGKSSLFNY
ncbi:MAG TPA: tRNA uridine-5-carboxymethylaminomethyl(34) synthesis GTPase MnmE, partial [Sphaerochaeta sp.]|nr:tRNA uridine-5-carboxymethylaminomethyl(34) synthesis GTPase MnmE [Sphaerochaeta sp.]